MKLLKKTLAILLCLIMAVGIMPLSASADTEPSDYVKTDFRFEAGQPVPTKRSQYTVKTSYIASEGVEIILSAYTTGLDYRRDGVRLNNDGEFTEQNSGTFLKNTGYQLKVCFTCRKYTERDLVLIAGDETYSYYDFEFRLDRVMIDGYTTEVWNVCYYYYIPIADMAQTVTTYAQLQSALSQYGNNAIKLGNDITKEIGLGKTEESEAAQLTVNGNKILNLNGKKLKVVDHSDVSSDKDYTLDSIRTLFTVPVGADFTVEDTRGTGEVKYDAHYISPAVARFDVSKYTDIAQRDMFLVYGKLTVNGGTFIAGGAKEQYLSDKFKNAYQIATGHIVLVENGGEATFNGGNFVGHTNFGYTAIVAQGKLVINGGEYTNNGVGHFLSSKIRNITINSGSFDINTYNAIRTYHSSGLSNECSDGSLNNFNFPSGSYDTSKIIMVKGGKLCYNPSADYLETYKEDDRIDIITTSLNAWHRKGKPIVFDSLAASCTYVIGADDIVSFKLDKLPEYLTDMGYSWDLAEVLYDTTGKKVYEYHNNGSDYDDGTFGFEDDCKTPGTYTYYIIVSLKNPDGNYCGFKKYTLLVKAIEPCKTHDYYVSSTTATCTSGGTSTEICTKCGDTKTTNVGALGHTYEEYEGEYQWSYDSTNHWKYCWRCDKTFNKGKHTFNSNNICTACGLDNNCDYGNAMDLERNETHHWWACETHAPEDACPNDHKLEYGAHEACSYEDLEGSTLDGVTNTLYNCGEGYVCDGCGVYFGETGNHTWVLSSTIPASCKATGIRYYKCTNNGKIDPKGNKVSCGMKAVRIPKTEHNWTLVSDTATCQADGKATYKCSGCGETKTVDSQKTGHIYGLVSDTATCTSSGEATYKCNTCSASYKEVSPAKGHNHIEDSYVAPTTEAEGKITYKCTDCGNVKTETLEKLSVIREPKTKSINCKDGVLIRPNFAVIPEGAKVEWTASNGCFNWSVDAEGNVKAISNSSGDTTFTAKVKLADGTYMTDMYGNEVVSTTTVKSNAGFFQKLIGFFKSLFGATKIHE